MFHAISHMLKKTFPCFLSNWTFRSKTRDKILIFQFNPKPKVKFRYMQKQVPLNRKILENVPRAFHPLNHSIIPRNISLAISNLDVSEMSTNFLEKSIFSLHREFNEVGKIWKVIKKKQIFLRHEIKQRKNMGKTLFFKRNFIGILFNGL
jgi:hypothetical protein